LLVRLRYSNNERKHVTLLIRHPLPPRSELAGEPSVRRWLRRIGPENQNEACQLERVHLRAIGAPASDQAELASFEQRAAAELAKNPPLSLSALAIDGKQLMARAGLRPGRHIGIILEALLERVLDDPTENDAERLLDHARSLQAEAKS
jgi:tRNA nucleotidyltransferase (CCA-adding enzyme)